MHPYAKPLADMKNPQTNELSADFFCVSLCFPIAFGFSGLFRLKREQLLRPHFVLAEGLALFEFPHRSLLFRKGQSQVIPDLFHAAERRIFIEKTLPVALKERRMEGMALPLLFFRGERCLAAKASQIARREHGVSQ